MMDNPRGEVLVAIINRPADLEIVREQGWYRIPVKSAPKRWPPQWLAFYQPKVFKDEAYSINYYGRVTQIRIACREEMFPNEPPSDRTGKQYYQVFLEHLERRERPIVSQRRRRIVFIPTTGAKFAAATEINDLYDDSPLEDALWQELKRMSIPAERQMDFSAEKARYLLDFAIYCTHGRIDIEADGDTWHADKDRIPLDNERNNALGAQGWQVLRFNGQQIREGLADYCIPKIAETINQLGGLSDDGPAPRTFHVSGKTITQQLTLFEKPAPYSIDSDSLDKKQ